jgi:hypothetical protein
MLSHTVLKHAASIEELEYDATYQLLENTVNNSFSRTLSLLRKKR